MSSDGEHSLIRQDLKSVQDGLTTLSGTVTNFVTQQGQTLAKIEEWKKHAETSQGHILGMVDQINKTSSDFRKAVFERLDRQKDDVSELKKHRSLTYERIETVEECLQEVKDSHKEISTTVVSVMNQGKGARRVFTAAAALVTLVLGGIGIYKFFDTSKSPNQAVVEKKSDGNH